MNAITVGLGQKPNVSSDITVLFLVWTVSACQPGNLRFTGPKRRFRHSQRIEEALLQKLFVRHAADDFNDARGDVHALIPVSVLLARLPLERTGHRAQRASF